jgi:hypothetical protein
MIPAVSDHGDLDRLTGQLGERPADDERTLPRGEGPGEDDPQRARGEIVWFASCLEPLLGRGDVHDQGPIPVPCRNRLAMPVSGHDDHVGGPHRQLVDHL